jgi:hypothetical protein
VESNDDTASNEFDATPMIAKINAGGGQFLPPLGLNRNNPAILPKVPALRVNNVNDIINAIGVAGSVSTLQASQKARIFRSIANLSSEQTAALANMSGGQLLTDLVQEATQQNLSLIASPAQGLDPAQQAGFNQIWNLNQGDQARSAGVTLNTLNGNSAAGYIEMGGYDYHNQGAANQLADDTAAGAMVGRVLASAAQLRRPVFLTVTTDGSVGHPVSADPSPPTSDRGQNGLIMVFAYDPKGKPELTGPQVGYYRNGNNGTIGVDTRSVVGGSPRLATAAVVANYLSFAGKGMGAIDALAPRLFSTEQLPQVVKLVR